MSQFVDTLIKQYEELKAERGTWESMWEDIAELVMPRKSDIQTRRTPGDKRTRKLFDSTALEANQRLAAAIGGTVTSPVIQWFHFDIPSVRGISELGKRPQAVDQWLHDVGTLMFRAMQSSNFNAEIEEVYQDLTAFGTAALYVEPRPFVNDAFDGIQFKALHIGDYFIDEDFDGIVNRLFRLAHMSVSNIASRWGHQALSPELARVLEEDPHKKFPILHAVFKRLEPINRVLNRFPIASVYIDLQHKALLHQAGFWEWPIPVARWSKVSGEKYGRGPGFTSLPDVQSLNKAEELGLRAWARAIDPPLLARHDGVIGTPDLRPARLNFVHDPSSDLIPFPQQTNMNLEVLKRDDKRNSIRRIFFMDQVQFIPERGKTPPTAAEIQARLNIMLQILGPTLSRLEFELLQPVIDRVFGIMMRSGAIPPPPPELLQLVQFIGGKIDVDFIGPIARAKRQSESASIQAAVGFAMQLAQAQPEVLDILNSDAIVRALTQIEGAPMTILRDQREVQQIRQARQQQMQQQMQLQALQEGGKAAKDISAAVRE